MRPMVHRQLHMSCFRPCMRWAALHAWGCIKTLVAGIRYEIVLLFM